MHIYAIYHHHKCHYHCHHHFSHSITPPSSLPSLLYAHATAPAAPPHFITLIAVFIIQDTLHRQRTPRHTFMPLLSLSHNGLPQHAFIYIIFQVYIALPGLYADELFMQRATIK